VEEGEGTSQTSSRQRRASERKAAGDHDEAGSEEDVKAGQLQVLFDNGGLDNETALENDEEESGKRDGRDLGSRILIRFVTGRTFPPDPSSLE
jgi:hypothetical protein